MPFETTAVKRVSVFCRDAEKSLALYRDVLGFSVIEDKTVSGPAIGKMVGLDSCAMRIVYLQAQASEDGLIGLFEISEADVPALAKPAPGKIHYGQTAIVVNTGQAQQVHDHLQSMGVEFLTPMTSYTKAEDDAYMKAGTYYEMIFYDPDNVLVSVLGYEPLSA